jgi:hypothetical protein
MFLLCLEFTVPILKNLHTGITEVGLKSAILETGETSNSFFVRHAAQLESASHSLQERSSVCQRSAQQASVEDEKYLQGWTVVVLLQFCCLSNLSFM